MAYNPQGGDKESGSYYDANQAKQNDETHGVSAGDGYTMELVTSPSALATEQTRGENDTAATQSNGYDINYYDPAAYQNYYYQSDDGNYYYYTDPQQTVSNDVAADINVNVTPTPQNIVRSYEYDSYAPYSFNWFVDIVVDTFFSKPFRVYLTVLLYCAAALIAALSLNFSFAMLYRMYSPPIPNASKDLQPFGYFAMFFYLSFVVVGTFCALMDMVRNIWVQKREDVVFWGMSHQYFSKQKPPYMVYLVIIVLTVPLPLFWGLIEAGINKQSVVYVAQRYANVAVLVATFLVVFCYAWLFWRALVYKRSAIHKRKERDDFELRQQAYRDKPGKMNKVHWYHASTVLEEFGMDSSTLLHNSIMFTVGGVPLFALYAAQTLSVYTGTPSVAWPAVASVALMCIYTISWMTLLRRKNQWAAYSAFALIVLMFILGIVGSAIGGYPQMAGIVVVLFVAAQGMVTRKRKHSLTRRELSATLKIPLNPGSDAQKSKEFRVDTYLFCCRDLILDYMKCCDVKKYFGYRHPDVVEAERRFMISRMALRADQKAFLVWWMIVMLAVAFVVAYSNVVSYKFHSTIASAKSTAVVGTLPSMPLCQRVYNAAGKAPLNMLDLAFLSALSYTWGTNGDTDFSTWFSSKPSLVRQYPVALPPSLRLATGSTNISFSDYVDVSTNYHVITLNSNSKGLALFRDLDDWGESIALQVAGAISPLINIWDEQSRAAFVRTGRFLKEWFPPSTALGDVSSYVAALKSTGTLGGLLIVGDQFNGGYAKRLSLNFDVPFVAFNPPGTKYTDGFLGNGTQLTSVRSLWSYIDSLEDTASTEYYPCNSTLSANRCGRISTVIEYLRSTCGDSAGRSMNEA
ncbi:hypothetical protein ABL78_7309 [Leptomonas seymouri]|uniref:Uncharacterized protein n=1 Tax=Leptomonas seymouri TaxID=5684 RepID=A0A0N1IHB4_LEPSE|nr:hypothetical protein ABL78_7309 [Leptomonas seymouri]|eukprot:KPI83653.1 hypothetical protein ABL78_7309 [Leptomonas seymouri]